MPSAATNLEPAATFPGAAFYRLRDDLVRTHLPADQNEQLLVTQIARTWLRHQQALDLESEIFAKSGASDLFLNHLDRFKAITRYVAETERMYRHAVDELRRTQRTRLGKSAPSSKSPNISVVQPVRPQAVELQNEPNPVPSNPRGLARNAPSHETS